VEGFVNVLQPTKKKKKRCMFLVLENGAGLSSYADITYTVLQFNVYTAFHSLLYMVRIMVYTDHTFTLPMMSHSFRGLSAFNSARNMVSTQQMLGFGLTVTQILKCPSVYSS